MFAGLRRQETIYRYDDPEHPDRVTSSYPSVAWSPADRALLAGLEHAETVERGHGDCPGCGKPIEQAWHSGMNGWYEVVEFVCQACSARDDKQVTHRRLRNTYPASKGPLPPFVLGKTTESP